MRFCFLLLMLLYLSACTNRESKLLHGKWQVKKININGTAFDSSFTANWSYVFLPSGKYTALLFATDTGNYLLKENAINFYSTIKTKPHNTVFKITRLDSLLLVLQSTDSNNIQLHLQKYSTTHE